jgi:outer membrane protein assembly factor BamB
MKPLSLGLFFLGSAALAASGFISSKNSGPCLECCLADDPTQFEFVDKPRESEPAKTTDKSAGPAIMFGGAPDRNLVNATGKGLPTEWQIETKKAKAKNIKWSAKLGSISYGGPLVAGGKVFVGTNNQKPRNPAVTGDKGVLMCFDEATGTFLWQATHDKLDNPNENDWPEQGVASTPAVDGNRIYYVSNRCELVCADVAGKPATKEASFIWKLDMMKDLKVFPRYLANSSPLLVGDLVYVVTANGIDGTNFKVVEPKAPSFVAVDKMKGTVVWQSNLPGEKIMDGQWTNASYAEVDGKGQVIFPGGDGWLYSFEAKTGELLWKFNGNPGKAKFGGPGKGEKNYFLATPVVYDKKVYIGVGRNPDDGAGVGHFWCIDITKKPVNKDKDLSPVDDDFDPKSPKNKDSGLVWHLGGEIKPKPKEGREVHFGRTISTASIKDDLLYIAELDGYLHCLDAKTGASYWDYDFKTSVWASTYWVDGKVLIGTEDGDLFIFEHGKKLTEPAKFEMGQPIKAPPVFVNGTLFVMTESALFAIAR